MSYYNECPGCGAHLDPGEECDCFEKLMAGEAIHIYQSNNGDVLGVMRDAYDLGYEKAERNISQGKIRKTLSRQQP